MQHQLAPAAAGILSVHHSAAVQDVQEAIAQAAAPLPPTTSATGDCPLVVVHSLDFVLCVCVLAGCSCCKHQCMPLFATTLSIHFLSLIKLNVAIVELTSWAGIVPFGGNVAFTETALLGSFPNML